MLASSPTKEGITRLINKYFFSDDKTVTENGCVKNSDGTVLTDFHVVKRKNRYYFEIK